MICDKRRRKSAKGFTLIELVVAITILGLLAVIVSSGLRTGLRAWSRGNSELDYIRSSQVQTSLLRRQIQGALPLLFSQNSDRQATLLFEGDAGKLRFVSRSSFRDGPEATPHWVELEWETRSGTGRLIVKESVIVPTERTPGAPFWQGAVLEGETLRFEYLTRRTSDRRPEWVSSWRDANLQMPAAVRISYARRGRSHQMVLPLTYAESSWSGRWFF